MSVSRVPARVVAMLFTKQRNRVACTNPRARSNAIGCTQRDLWIEFTIVMVAARESVCVVRLGTCSTDRR